MTAILSTFSVHGFIRRGQCIDGQLVDANLLRTRSGHVLSMTTLTLSLIGAPWALVWHGLAFVVRLADASVGRGPVLRRNAPKAMQNTRFCWPWLAVRASGLTEVQEAVAEHCRSKRRRKLHGSLKDALAAGFEAAPVVWRRPPQNFPEPSVLCFVPEFAMRMELRVVMPLLETRGAWATLRCLLEVVGCRACAGAYCRRMT